MPRARTGKSRRVMRHLRVRRKVKGTTKRPRLAVFRTLKHVYAQIIDDTQSRTLTAVSSLESQVKEVREGKSKTDVSKTVGALLAQRAKDKGITTVVFDRGGYKYHGRVKALADAAHEGGLIF
ncbi:MAG: 50S ribosomal protein L18 [Dehalococcoidia bacterium]|nr:50S ribosomal protein L18 [Dehalococcoidia bacterium]